MTGSEYSSGCSGASDDDGLWPVWQHLWNPQGDPADLVARSPADVPSNDDLDDSLRGVLPLLQETYQDLLAPSLSTVPRWTRDQTVGLFRELRRVARPNRSYIVQRRVLEVIDAGNRVGRWVIPIVSLPAPLPPPPRPFFDDAGFRVMSRYQYLPHRFAETLSCGVTLTDKEAWGQIFGACLILGGLLQINWLWSVPHSVNDAPAHLEWIDLLHRPSSSVGESRRRHFLDPVSRLLLLRWRESGFPAAPRFRRRGSKELFSCISAYARRVGIAEELPESFADLRNVVRVRLGLYISPHLLAFCSGTVQSTSLPRAVMERLVEPLPDDFISDSNLQESASEVVTFATTEETDEAAASEAEEPELLQDLKDLTSIVYRGDSDAKEQLEAFRRDRCGWQGSCLKSIERLAEWVEFGLFTSGRGRRATAAKTAYDRFNAIAARLVGQLGRDDPASLQEGDYVELYTNALEDTSSMGGRHRVARGLQSFHDYLVNAYNVPAFSNSNLLSVRGGHPHSVDANMVAPEAFEWSMTWLDFRYQDNPNEADQTVLMASLGYYAGLRRSEVAGLRIRDLEGPPDWNLIVTPTSIRRLKSQSAERVVPLGALLPAERLRRLHDWLNKRCASIHGSNSRDATALLFDEIDKREPSSSTRKAPIKKLKRNQRRLDHVRDALVRSTGDHSLRFHHLRHSFANRMLLALWSFEQTHADALPPWARSLIGMDVGHVRTSLLGKAPVQRRSLALISALLGHSDTAITMVHYIHLVDLVSARATRGALPPLSTASLSDLSGRSERQFAHLPSSRDGSSRADQLDYECDVKLGRGERAESRPVAKTRRLTQPEDRFDELLLLTRVINDYVAGSRLCLKLLPPWPERLWQQWANTATQLPEHFRKTRHGGLHQAILDPPRTQQDRSRARVVVEWLSALTQEQQWRFIESYLAGKLPTNPLDVAFRHVSDLQNWQSLLSALGLQSAVDYLHVPNPQSRVGSRSAQLAYWRRRTKIPLIPWRRPPKDMESVADSERGRVLCLHRSGDGPETDYWAHGVCYAVVATYLRDHVEP